MLKPDEVLKQSKSAFNQWKDLWSSNARKNGKIYKEQGITQRELLYNGVGKTLLCCAFAPSFEDNIDKIKKSDAVDIACVDKCMGSLIDRGVKPDYVFIADAMVDYEKWCEPYIDQTEDITLIANVTCNTKWTHNWKGRIVFFVNKDNIETEKIYIQESGCSELIPAASNVGNALVVFTSQIMGYDRYLLLGYDFCWGDDDNYYAFNDSDKRYWMKHMVVIDKLGRLVNTSQNLYFSARWLSDFYQGVLAPNRVSIYDVSGKGICSLPEGDLERQLSLAERREPTDQEKKMILDAHSRKTTVTSVEALNDVLSKGNIVDVTVRQVDGGTLQWLNCAI